MKLIRVNILRFDRQTNYDVCECNGKTLAITKDENEVACTLYNLLKNMYLHVHTIDKSLSWVQYGLYGEYGQQ